MATYYTGSVDHNNLRKRPRDPLAELVGGLDHHVAPDGGVRRSSRVICFRSISVRDLVLVPVEYAVAQAWQEPFIFCKWWSNRFRSLRLTSPHIRPMGRPCGKANEIK